MIPWKAGRYAIELICARKTWLVIGKAFEFQQPTSLRRRCMNPRCPDPDPAGGAQKVCTQCCWVFYCSGQCQTVWVPERSDVCWSLTAFGSVIGVESEASESLIRIVHNVSVLNRKDRAVDIYLYSFELSL
ncbi:hypothetical protein B0J17DRAFT_388330 [Rhizoctonia solani]|nr:hypothetical protein B0J17DRAFT_388330 [Rhizoctonia solani]